MSNLIHSTEHALPSMCAGQAQIYLERTIPHLFGRPLKAAKLWTIIEDDRYFDVYQVLDPESGRKERFYFDVTPYFGRGDCPLEHSWRDLPEPNRRYSIWRFFTESELRSISIEDRSNARSSLDDFTVSFKQYSSEQVGNRIATCSSRERTFNVTPVRSYANGEIPFLHGYLFYKLFVFHQILHLYQGHDVRFTELGPQREGKPALQKDDGICFVPLAPFDFARDFLNFMFSTHRHDAFEVDAELSCFAETARFGVDQGAFSSRELRHAIVDARLDSDLEHRLRAAIGLDAPRPSREPAENSLPN